MKASSFFRLISFLRPLNPDLASILIITIVWLVMLTLVNPIGNFPLNDDWAYGWTVKTWLEKSSYQLSDWTATNLLSQAIWGILFCLPFGFSFTALRLSTLTLGLLGVLATYGVLREIGTQTKVALIGALVVAFNPIYLGLSNSFSTDVPSFAFSILSLYLIVRGIRLSSNYWLLAGIVMSFVSILNRQSGIVILFGFAITLLVKKGIKKQTLILAGSPILLGILFQIAYSQWLEISGKKPILYGFQIQHFKETFSQGIATVLSTYTQNALIVAMYLGLFLFPFVLLCVGNYLKDASLRQRYVYFLVILFAIAGGAVFLLKSNIQLPLIGNTLETFGLGPQAFEGYSSVLSSNTQIIFYRIWKIFTLVAFIGAVFLVLCILSDCLKVVKIKAFNESRQEANSKSLFVLALSIALSYFVLIGGLDQRYWFDRYLIFVLPICMMLIATLHPHALETSFKPGWAVISLVILLIYGGFSVAATHDYLTLNRVRWQALNNLTEIEKVLPEKIYGGFEFNGWYFGNQLEICNPGYQNSLKSSDVKWGTFDCLWGANNNSYRYRYTIGFYKDKPGYLFSKQYSFERWLPLIQQELYVIKKV